MALLIADRLELSDLVHRYAAYVDARRFADVAELFTATGKLTVPTPPEHLTPTVRHDGHDGLRTAMAALGGIARTQHAIVGEVYTATTDGNATGAITGVAHHWTTKGGQITDLVWYLRYADEYRHCADGWRIAVREITIDAIATGPARQVRGGGDTAGSGRGAAAE